MFFRIKPYQNSAITVAVRQLSELWQRYKQPVMKFCKTGAMANRPTLPKKRAAWTKVVIFIALYILLLESLIEWVLVFYLYGNKHVDSEMTPSLVLALVSSFVTVPLVSLHSLLAWQYNKVVGHVAHKKTLHTICTHVLRVNVLIWLAASVAGLVVISQQASCLPDDTDASYWRIGVSCALHRAVVIVAVLSFVTICIYFCTRELCDRPYDVSLLGIYNQPNRARDGSITSNSSWDSENTLKNEIHFCRRPGAPYTGQGLHWSDDTVVEKPAIVPSIQQPAPVRAKPQLKLSTALAPETADIMNGSAVSLNGTVPSEPVSRTSTVLTSPTANEHGQAPFIAELPGAPNVPQIPAKFGHKREKSSMSSLRKFLPKSLPISLPLSADPQIRALSNPNVCFDLEKQAEKAFLSQPSESAQKSISPSKPQPAQTVPTEIPKHQSCPAIQSESSQNREQRTMTISSDDAPEVVSGPQSQKVQTPSNIEKFNNNSSSSQPLHRSVHHPHHPAYLYSAPSTSSMHSIPTRPLSSAGILPPGRSYQYHYHQQPDRPRRHSSRRYSNMGPGRQSHMYQYETSQMPRLLQSQSPVQAQAQHHRPLSHLNFHNYPIRHNIGTVPRRHDVEIIYPSTRRSRSSTYGGISSALPLDSIKESRASFDEVPGHGQDHGNGCGHAASGSEDSTGGTSTGTGMRQLLDENTYRGTNWTMPGSGSGSGC